MTGAEAKLWDMLRGRRFENLKFRRQAPLAGYIVDFLCADLRLVIELDGGVHVLAEGADTARDERLANAGYAVLRFKNEAFLKNPAVVLAQIKHRSEEMRVQPPHPTRFAGHLLPRGEKESRWP